MSFWNRLLVAQGAVFLLLILAVLIFSLPVNTGTALVVLGGSALGQLLVYLSDRKNKR